MAIRLYKNRYLRTVFLALFATLSFVASAIFVFDVEPMVMLQFFIVSLIGLAVVVAAALIFTVLRVFIKHFFQR